MNFTLCKNRCNYTKRNKQSRNPPLSAQPFQNRTIPRPAPPHLPPLSKGGGLTARHKLLLCCVLIATHLPFLFTKLFCRQDGGIATPLLPKPHFPSKSTISLPPLSKVRCCRPKEFGRLPEGLPHHSSQNRTIPPAFRRVSVCVCLYGFASVQNLGHTRLRHPCLFMNALLALRPAKPLGVHFRHPCLACPSRCTQPFHPHNHCKRTIIHRSALNLPPLSKVRCCRPKKFGRLPEGLYSVIT